MNPLHEAQVYSRQEYATKQFWDARYRQKQSYFDWYAEFPQLKQTFEGQYGLRKQYSILMLGCGNSKLSEQMYEQGYHNILNIDISPAVIHQMEKVSKQKGQTKMEWKVMDATNMSEIQDHTFDAIIDKGTLDALISGKNMEICHKMLNQSMRVLKKDGQFILITYGSPEGRKKLFESSIGLKNYDYYFTKVDLSSMSTLINLMRNNLGDKPLSAITKDTDAMKKSLMEFNMVKILRRNRKETKKFIVWSSFQRKQVVFNENQTIENKQQHQKSNFSPQKQQNKEMMQTNTNNEPQQTNKTQPEQLKKINYSPKKQSFCYVYSISPKFAIDLCQITEHHPETKQTLNKDGSIFVQGRQSALTIGIYPDDCFAELNRALFYLQTTNNMNNNVLIYKSLSQLNQAKEQVKVIFREGAQNILPSYSKASFQVNIEVKNKSLCELQKIITKAQEQIVEKGGILIHPSPTTYAYIGCLMQRVPAKLRFSQFLKKFWYPGFQLISFNQCQAKYIISLPPLSEWDSISIVQKLKSLIPNSEITQIKAGYLNYFDPRAMSLLGLCSLTYSQGESLDVIVEQTQNRHGQKQFKSEGPIVYFKRDIMEMVFARFICDL